MEESEKEKMRRIVATAILAATISNPEIKPTDKKDKLTVDAYREQARTAILKADALLAELKTHPADLAAAVTNT